MTRIGRPSKLNQDHPTEDSLTIAEVIPRDLAAGIFATHAAERAGITDRTYLNWINRGRAHTEYLYGLHNTHGEDPEDWPADILGEAQTAHNIEADFAAFFRACKEASANAKARITSRILQAAEPRLPEVLRDARGEAIVVDGRVQTSKPQRGDWRAAAWWLERADPSSFHLSTVQDERGAPPQAPDTDRAVDDLIEALSTTRERLAVSEDGG